MVRSALDFEFPLANDVRSYPGWPVGHEAASWLFWIMGSMPLPASQDPGAVNPGGGAFPGTSVVANFGAQWERYAPRGRSTPEARSRPRKLQLHGLGPREGRRPRG